MEKIMNEQASEVMNEKAESEKETGTNEMTANVQKCTENKETDKEERMFTESELEAVVRERLKRDRKVNEELLSVKKLLKEAGEKGLIRGTSYAEMAKSLEEILMSRGSENKAADTQEALPENNENTSSAAEEDGKNDVADDGEKTSEAGMEFFGILSQLKKKYPTADELLSGGGLSKFAKGRSGSAEEIFDDYYEFMSCLEEETKGAATGHAALSSTAFSSSSSGADTTFGLTKQQMEMAKSEGLSYREYAHLLENVPRKARKNN